MTEDSVGCNTRNTCCVAATLALAVLPGMCMCLQTMYVLAHIFMYTYYVDKCRPRHSANTSENTTIISRTFLRHFALLCCDTVAEDDVVFVISCFVINIREALIRLCFLSIMAALD